MRVVVDTLAATGRQVALRLGEPWVAEAAEAVFDVAALALDGRIDIQPPLQGRVRVEVALQAHAVGGCDRCGEAVDIRVDTTAELAYAPEGPVPGADVELMSDELDIGWYRDGAIDLGDVLREAIALAVPPRWVCDDVPACDARMAALLDEASAGAAGGHPAFAALKDLR